MLPVIKGLVGLMDKAGAFYDAEMKELE